MKKFFKIISIFCISAFFLLFFLYNPETSSWCYQVTPSPELPVYKLFFSYLISIFLYFFADASVFLVCIPIGLFYTQKKMVLIQGCLYFCLYSCLWSALYQKTVFATLPGGFLGIQLSLLTQRWLDPYLIGPFLTTLFFAGIIFYAGTFISLHKK